MTAETWAKVKQKRISFTHACMHSMSLYSETDAEYQTKIVLVLRNYTKIISSLWQAQNVVNSCWYLLDTEKEVQSVFSHSSTCSLVQTLHMVTVTTCCQCDKYTKKVTCETKL
jgi:hypothetical protein